MVTKKKSWRDVVQIHPAAEVFPLMSDNERYELAADIKKNSLRNPVTLWEQLTPEGPITFLLDGRNRLDAMELAGIPLLTSGPKPDKFGVEKPDPNGTRLMRHIVTETSSMSSYTAGAAVVGLNIHRRHLTASQRAKLAAAAMLTDKMYLAGLKKPQVTATVQDCTDATATAGQPPTNKFAKGNTANKSLVAEVAEAANVHRHTARAAIKEVEKEMNLKIAAQPDTPELTRAKEMVLAHPAMSNMVIASLADCGKTTVAKARKQLGLASNPQPNSLKKKSTPPTGVEVAVNHFAALVTTLHAKDLSADYLEKVPGIVQELTRIISENGAK